MSDATIYFVAGERSGDNHGAALLKALRARAPKMQFLGRGGPKMRTIADGTFRDWIDDTAVVGLWEVIRRYPFFRKQFQATISEIDAARPRRGGVDRLPRVQSSACSCPASEVFRAENYLLHQPASLGLESAARFANGTVD
jgi:hypothetical protein